MNGFSAACRSRVELYPPAALVCSARRADGQSAGAHCVPEMVLAKLEQETQSGVTLTGEAAGAPDFVVREVVSMFAGRTEIFVINLEYRTDRRLAMRKQLSRLGWSAEFFPAIRPQEPAGFESIGARGCFLSHLSVLKKAEHAGAQHVVILEDDFNFGPGFTNHWRSAMSALAAQEWSIFYPGHVMKHLPAGLSRVAPETGIMTTHFMVINRPALPKLIAGLETILSRPPGHPLGGPMHVDGAYSTLRAQNHTLTTYAYFPALGYQRSSRSDVGPGKWSDRVGVLSPLVDAVRKWWKKIREIF